MVMLPFAVHVDELHGDGSENPDELQKGSWVIAIEGDRLLLAVAEDPYEKPTETKLLRWFPMADCQLIRLQSPDLPWPVMAVQPVQPSKIDPVHGIIRPNGNSPNRAMRRRG